MKFFSEIFSRAGSFKKIFTRKTPGSPQSSVSVVTPKTALPFNMHAPVDLTRTFASQFRVLARIFFPVVKILIRAQSCPGNILIVPFSLNSPDLRVQGGVKSRVSEEKMLIPKPYLSDPDSLGGTGWDPRQGQKPPDPCGLPLTQLRGACLFTRRIPDLADTVLAAKNYEIVHQTCPLRR